MTHQPHRYRRSRIPGGVSLLLTLLLLTGSANAQFRLLIGQPHFTGYPSINIPFEILDNTSTLDSITTENFQIWENGVRMLPIQLDCSEAQIAPKIHFYFVMDVSYSMGFREDTTLYDLDSVKWRTAKQVFIDAYAKLRPQDEGALGSFARTFVQEQEFTTNKRFLIDATMGMGLRSGTAIYDAIEVASAIANEKEGKKVIILLTDGVDNSSRLTREQAITFAWKRGVPVFPIGLGLYFDVNQPFRVDEDTIRRIADGTGGTAYFAPTSEDLSRIFDEIIEHIYSFGCVLRYTTPDTCRDGGVRVIDVQADLNGTVLKERFSYTLPDLRSRLHLRLAMPAEALRAGGRYDIPVVASGEIRPGEATDFLIVVRHDPDLIDIEGIGSPGTVFDVSQLTVESLSPGVTRISGAAVMPARGIPYDEDVLFTLQIRVHDRNTLAETRLELEFPQASQICDIVSSAEGTDAVVHACPAFVVAGFDTTIVAMPGRIVDVPILLRSGIDFNQTLRYDLQVAYDDAVFTYEGFTVDGCISEHLHVTANPATGRLDIHAAEGMPSDTSAILLTLRFRTAMMKEAQPVSFRLSEASFVQKGIGILASECVPAIVLEGHRLLADGICRPLILRKNGLQLGQNSPNPVSSHSGSTFAFTVTGTAPVRLEIVDEFGRCCAVLVDGQLARGRHTIFWHPGSLPSGVYLCVLREGAETRTRKVLVTR
ncbi:MAG: VWA domain-containing protein [Bacteroidetes bacterium]|nr:VWA domain-containing protein [Bacteroidota bacterium]